MKKADPNTYSTGEIQEFSSHIFDAGEELSGLVDSALGIEENQQEFTRNTPPAKIKQENG